MKDAFAVQTHHLLAFLLQFIKLIIVNMDNFSNLITGTLKFMTLANSQLMTNTHIRPK